MRKHVCTSVFFFFFIQKLGSRKLSVVCQLPSHSNSNIFLFKISYFCFQVIILICRIIIVMLKVGWYDCFHYHVYKLLPPEPNVIFHSTSECGRCETIELSTVLVMPSNFIFFLYVSTLNAEEFCYNFPLTLIYFDILLWFKCILIDLRIRESHEFLGFLYIGPNMTCATWMFSL